MIDKLTVAQEALLKEYRDKVFGYATSTVTDKTKAEATARRLTKGILVEPEIHWISSPEEVRELLCSLRGSLLASLSDSPWDSLLVSLPDSLPDSLRGSLLALLSDSLRASLLDSGFVAHCPGIVKYEESVSMRLMCYEELNESCFAMYVLPGHIILLEKPKRVKIEDGKLIEIEW